MQKGSSFRSVLLIVMVVSIGIALVSLTVDIEAETPIWGFLFLHKTRVITAEIALMAVIVVEIAMRLVLRIYEAQNARQAGVAMRAVIRTVSYTIIGVVIVTILSSNPALAVSVGGMTGIIVGFAAQNLLANVLAGLLIALARPFRLDDQITVMGITGRVVEFGVMHTMIYTVDMVVLIPNSALMTQVIQRKPLSIGMEGE
ncbi:MAG: mechanosensitive ion channel family protein [Chloroflexi bacterium]|nr:mechanosensitive ion channel family protein [Chloroflexota bacterium]